MKKFIAALTIALLLPIQVGAQPFPSAIEAARGRLKLFTTALLPSSCAPGLAVFDTTTQTIKVCQNDGSTWTAVGSSGITINTTTITGGTNTRVLFDDSGVVGEDAAFTFVKATGVLSATRYRAGDGSAAAPSFSFTNGTGSGMRYFSGFGLYLTAEGVDQAVFIGPYTMFTNPNYLAIGSGTKFFWADTANPLEGSNNVGIARNASGELRVVDAAGTGVANFLAQNPVTAKATTPITVAVNDAGRVFTNEGASAQIVFNLPTAATSNGPFTFYVQDTDGIQVVASTGDTIRVGTGVSSAGGTATNSTAGSFITLIAINATEWISFSSFGTWTLA